MNNQAKFFQMLSEVKFVSRYFDEAGGCMLIDQIESDIAFMSDGERSMLQFFAGVWEHNGNRFGEFNLINAMQSLDERNRDVITAWCRDPFFP